jgi:hypothetical protein
MTLDARLVAVAVVLVVHVGRAVAEPAPGGPARIVADTAAAPSKVEDGRLGKAVTELELRLPGQLATANVAEQKRQEVMGLVAKLKELLTKKPEGSATQESLVREFLARGGELRDLLEDLHLPDPGDLLPPGPRSRLGIVFSQGEGRATVSQVLPQYRADKMGMRVGDTILTLNGVPVLAKGLIEAVVKAKRPYVIEVLRGGKHITLEEPKR